MLKYFPRILRGRRKNEEYAEINILGWKGLVPLMFKILEKSNSRDIYSGRTEYSALVSKLNKLSEEYLSPQKTQKAAVFLFERS